MLRRSLPCVLTRLTSCRSMSQKSNTKLLAQSISTRSLLRISGSTAAEYLQGLITNDINHVVEGASSMFTMFLNSRGRVLYESIVYKSAEKDTFLLECDSNHAEDLKRHLVMFKVRRKISVDNLDAEKSIWNVSSSALVNDIMSSNAIDESALTVTKAILTDLESMKDIITTQDPRTPALGLRIIAQKDLNLNKELDAKQEDFYRPLRYMLGIGEGIGDHPRENSLPLEANCDYLHGVSFHKGCYIGQELTARTHHTGVVRKRLMPMIFEDDASDLPVDSTVTSELSEKSLGKVRGVCGKQGLGLLRVEEVLKSEKLTVGGKTFKTAKPFWWPSEAPKDRLRST